MKVVVAVFNQEKALVGSLLRDCTTSPINRSQLYLRAPAAVLAGRQGGEAEDDQCSGDGGAGGHGAGTRGQGRS